GGARMAEIAPIGDLAHELESLYEGLLDKRYSPSPALLQLLQQSHDHLGTLLDQLQARRALSSPAELVERIRQFRQNGGESLTVPSAVPAPQAEASLEEAAEEIALDELPAEETPVDEQATEAAAEALEPWPDDWSTVETDAPSASDEEPQPEVLTAEPEQPVSDEADSLPPFQTAEEPQAPIEAPAPSAASAPAYEPERDPELVEIFLEEGFDI